MKEKFDASFGTFSDRIECAVNEIPADKVIKTNRTGLAGLRDKLVFGKSAWNEAMTYFGIVTTLVTLAALTPIAVGNINLLLEPVGIKFPVVFSSLMTFVLLICLFIFGYLSFKYFGMIKRSSEIGAKLSSCDYVEWQDLQVIKGELQEIRELLHK